MTGIHANFETDWTTMLRTELAALGFTASANDTTRDLAIKTFNARKRRVPIKPRSVHVSRELTVPPGHALGYQQLRKKIETGDDLLPHLSTRIVKAKSSDGLLNDWAIHHLHLGTAVHPTNPAFVERTGPVLLVHFTDEAAYLVDIVDHDNWSAQRYLEILKANWPELLVRVRVSGTVGGPVTDAEVEHLRNAGINSILAVQGESFAGVGGGYVTTRAAADAVWYATMGTSAIRRLQKQVLQDAQQIASTLTKARVSVADPIALRAHFADGHVFVVEESSGTVVKFGDFPVLAG